MAKTITNTHEKYPGQNIPMTKPLDKSTRQSHYSLARKTITRQESQQ